MSKKIQYVIGLQFGDEGKGKTVQYLCKEAIKQGKKPLVVRYCSGPQASHTVYSDDLKHICSSFGSGVLLGVPTLILDDTITFVDPIALVKEYEVLQKKGLNPKFYVTQGCHIITPYDVIANRNNKESLENGTCGCGVWEAFRRDTKEFCGPCLYDEEEDYSNILKCVREYYEYEENKELEKEFIKDLKFIKEQPIIDVDNYDVIIMESSQGLLLDGFKGLKPYITPAKIFPYVDYDGNITSDVISICDEIEMFLCTRTYTTRHGAGYEPKESQYIKYPKYETNKDNEFQGKFKKGILDVDLINRAIDRHCIDNIENVKFNLVVNHMDCVGTQLEYIYKDEIHTEAPDKIFDIVSNKIRLNFEDIYFGYSEFSKFAIV